MAAAVDLSLLQLQRGELLADADDPQQRGRLILRRRLQEAGKVEGQLLNELIKQTLPGGGASGVSDL